MKSRLHVLGTSVHELVYDTGHICSFQTAKLGAQCLSDSLFRTCVTCQIHSERKSRRGWGESSHRDSPFFQMCRTGCKRAFPEPLERITQIFCLFPETPVITAGFVRDADAVGEKIMAVRPVLGFQPSLCQHQVAVFLKQCFGVTQVLHPEAVLMLLHSLHVVGVETAKVEEI